VTAPWGGAFDGPDVPHALRDEVAEMRRDEVADGLRDEVTELRRLLLRVERGRALPAELATYYDRLTGAGVDERLAFRILDTLEPSTDGARERGVENGARERDIEDAIVRALGEAAPPAPAVGADATLAFVGPAGGGKTSTVAKLAVQARMGRQAAHIVSVDGESLGGRAHLEALSALAGVPHALAVRPGELRDAIAAIPPGARTLIDTPGVSPGDRRGVAALGALLEAAGPTEVHLVLPATTKAADALLAAEAFAPLGARRLVFTRLDETSTPGSLVTITAAVGLTLAYFGTGREIPHDLRPASARDLARRVLMGELPR
jgi:flagellar biosynthesis protein FlhF